MNRLLSLVNKFSSVNSIREVIITLKTLDTILPQTELAYLKPFNHAYIIITKNVYREVRNDRINKIKEMEILDINFAHFYFSSLKNYLNGGKVPKAWKIAFEFYKKGNSNPLIYLMLGANAHINNDLSFSLAETIRTDDFKNDYKTVQKIIDQSIKEIIGSTDGNSKPIHTLYSLILKGLMRTWRRNAWKNFLKLKKNQISGGDIEENAARTANMIIFVTQHALRIISNFTLL